MIPEINPLRRADCMKIDLADSQMKTKSFGDSPSGFLVLELISVPTGCKSLGLVGRIQEKLLRKEGYDLFRNSYTHDHFPFQYTTPLRAQLSRLYSYYPETN